MPISEASIRTVHEAFQHYVALSGSGFKSFFKGLHALEQYPSRYADTIAAQLPFKVQGISRSCWSAVILKNVSFAPKFIQKETEVFSMSQKIKGRVKEQMDKLQKRHYLNEQMRAIRKEMGEDGQGAEFVDLEKGSRPSACLKRPLVLCD